MNTLSDEQRLKHFQLALSMVGITANLMSCELIHLIAAEVDRKQGDFSLRDATRLAEAIQHKYQQVPPQQMYPSQEEIEKMIAEQQFPHSQPEQQQAEVPDPENTSLTTEPVEEENLNIEPVEEEKK